MSAVTVYRFGDPALARWSNRRPTNDPALVRAVSHIIEEVEREGLDAVLRHTQRFDSHAVSSVFVTDEELGAVDLPKGEHAEAIRSAIARVTEFHELQLETVTEGMTRLQGGWGWRTYSHEREDGTETGMLGQRLLPVASAGIYVPGGQAEYPSSVVMNVVPALVAGVGRTIVATPPRSDGSVSPAVLFACRELGVKTILKAGGASAIAALALGGKGLERVDIVAGPGNRYVNEAKRQLWGTVGLDAYAGPSEVCVVVDDEADSSLAAYDLLTQIEHAEDNVALLVGTSEATINAVLAEIERLLDTAPRAATMARALREHGAAVVCDTLEQCAEVANSFAPEHLALHVEDPTGLLPLVPNAGAVMMGPWTAQSVADYCEGPSHTLPTSGAARFASPLNVLTFMRLQSVSMLDQEDAEDLAQTAGQMAELEGLPMHGEAARARLTHSDE